MESWSPGLGRIQALTKPRVVLTAKNGVTEVSEGNVVTFVATLMDATGASDGLDSLRGIRRGAGETGDYSISGMLGEGAAALDRGVSSLWADESEPAYTQTLGWKLAEILPSWMQ